ncbi:hypothetical protein, partial [Pseudomonas brassicae]|uniref:hypothetical protein n=1 Tax=Pseudomonas brassicae TaxID=2708063 RepID=UPI003B75C3F9
MNGYLKNIDPAQGALSARGVFEACKVLQIIGILSYVRHISQLMTNGSRYRQLGVGKAGKVDQIDAQMRCHGCQQAAMSVSQS